MLLGLGAALAAAAVFGVAAVLQAIGARRVPEASGLDPRMLLRLLREPAFVAAVALNVAGFLLHLVALRTVPLYLAQAGIAASLVVTAALAVRLFGDRLSAVEWAAVGAVCVGLALLTTAAGPPGQEQAGTAANASLFVAVGLIAVAGLAAVRRRGRGTAAVLGLLAGLGFAADSVAVRLLPGLSPAELWDAPATYALLLSAGLAFLLYSVALQRGAVTAATAPMMVAQTAAPAVVGVLLLGDAVRPGYLPAAVAGMVLTAVGAGHLARFEGASRAEPAHG
jgi:drug/metabolite transporter (DMT)-like permease